MRRTREAVDYVKRSAHTTLSFTCARRIRATWQLKCGCVGELRRGFGAWTIRHTNLILDEPPSDLFPGPLILAFQSPDKYDIAARRLPVQRAVHIGIARLAMKLGPGCSFGGADSGSIVDQRRLFLFSHTERGRKPQDSISAGRRAQVLLIPVLK